MLLHVLYQHTLSLQHVGMSLQQIGTRQLRAVAPPRFRSPVKVRQPSACSLSFVCCFLSHLGVCNTNFRQLGATGMRGRARGREREKEREGERGRESELVWRSMKATSLMHCAQPTASMTSASTAVRHERWTERPGCPLHT